jgi:hypothetical protein
MRRTDGVRLPDRGVEAQGLVVAAPGLLVVGARQGDVAEAPDAVGLAQDLAHLSVHREDLLVAAPGLLVVGSPQGDFTEVLVGPGDAGDIASRSGLERTIEGHAGGGIRGAVTPPASASYRAARIRRCECGT